MAAALTTMDAGAAVSYEARFRTASGTYRWLSVTARPFLGKNGHVAGHIGSCRNVDDEVLARRALAQSEQRLRLAMDSTPIGMAVVDLSHRFQEVNLALCRMVGRTPDWLLVRRVSDILMADSKELDRHMRQVMLSGRVASVTRETQLRTVSGSELWVQHSISLVHDPAGRLQSFVSQFLDITEARLARESLTFMATHDSLTSLLNRREFMARLSDILSEKSAPALRVAILYVDIDGLKPLNDSYGHAAGDCLIMETGQRLVRHVRNDDLVARFGGDEFVIAMPSVSSAADAAAVAERIHAAAPNLITFEGSTIAVSVSIGITVAERGDDLNSTLCNADAALYRAKKSGRARTVVFDPAFDPAFNPTAPKAYSKCAVDG